MVYGFHFSVESHSNTTWNSRTHSLGRSAGKISGANREERSERYETTLRVGYKISTHITANFHLGLSYHHDRVEEGRDFLSVASALTSPRRNPVSTQTDQNNRHQVVS